MAAVNASDDAARAARVRKVLRMQFAVTSPNISESGDGTVIASRPTLVQKSSGHLVRTFCEVARGPIQS
jgi:hypothetical protein